jgi:hypothetical protein
MDSIASNRLAIPAWAPPISVPWSRSIIATDVRGLPGRPDEGTPSRRSRHGWRCVWSESSDYGSGIAYIDLFLYVQLILPVPWFR